MQTKLYKTAISLGGNLGDSKAIFASALKLLDDGGLKNIEFSSLFCSKAENCPPNSSDFTNAAIIGEWQNSPQELLDLCQKIEVLAGRPHEHGFNEPRTLDLDIILFDSEIIDLPNLQIPHPLATKRLFVLKPLAEIGPEWIFPDSNKTVKEVLQSFLIN